MGYSVSNVVELIRPSSGASRMLEVHPLDAEFAKLAALGVIDGHVGAGSPADTKQLWLDTNPSPAAPGVPKYHTGSAWAPTAGTRAVARHIADASGINTRGYDARDFGVSTTNPNNAAALNAAITAVNAAGGGTLILPPGTLNVGSTVYGKSLVSIRGAGMDATIIRIPQVATAGGGMSSHPLIFEDVGAFVLSDFTVLGNRGAWPGGTPPTPSPFVGVYIAGCFDFSIERVKTYNIEGYGFSLNKTNLSGGCTRFSMRACVADRTRTGLFVFKGSGLGSVTSCDFLQSDEHGVAIDDATASDVTAATSAANVLLVVNGNRIVTFGKKLGGSAGILASGLQNATISDNLIYEGGVSGTFAAHGIVVNSGQSNYNDSFAVTVQGNTVYGMAGGSGITLQGAKRCTVIGNSLYGLHAWTSVLTGAAINLLDNGTGSGTQGNFVSGNVIEGSTNTPIGVLVGASTGQNQVGGNLMFNVATHYSLAVGAGQGQVRDLGYVQSLPAWHAAYRGARAFNQTDDKEYVATSSAWVVIGTQV